MATRKRFPAWLRQWITAFSSGAAAAAVMIAITALK